MFERDFNPDAILALRVPKDASSNATGQLSCKALARADASALAKLLVEACHRHPDIAEAVRSHFSHSLPSGDESKSGPIPVREPMMVGNCPAMQAVFRAIRRYAATDSPVLITGESGTGKELAAQAIHERSNYSTGPFIAVNCGGLPVSLIGSELFGHEKGAFTGSTGRRIGHIETANGGTLFLDEIGDMPIDLQTNFLRFLENRKIVRLGGNNLIDVDTRVVAATNIDLEQAVNEGRFRRDLYFRLNVLRIHLPPLRERDKDLELLVKFFVHRLSSEMGVLARNFTADGLAEIKAYEWPGNVRELISKIRRALVMADGEILDAGDLEIDRPPMSLAPCGPASAEELEKHRQATARRLPDVRKRAEADAIVSALEHNRYNVTRAARDLGIARATIYKRMRKLGIKA